MTSCFRFSACRPLLAALIALVALPACVRGERVSCGEVERLIDSRAPTHVIDVDAAKYDFHPPTSGPHFGGKPPEPGVHSEPVPEAMQVLSLEFGTVVLQYDESVADDAAQLEALARGRKDVIVAPAATPIDGERHVAFTAWERRQLCDGISDEVIKDAAAWIEEHAGVVPEEFRS